MQAGYLCLVLAFLAALGHAWELGILLGVTAAAIGILGPTDEQRDARFRNHARRIR